MCASVDLHLATSGKIPVPTRFQGFSLIQAGTNSLRSPGCPDRKAKGSPRSIQKGGATNLSSGDIGRIQWER